MATHRTHIILPEVLINSIDDLVGRRKRSAFIAEVADREIRRRRLMKVLDRPDPIWNPADHPEIDAAGGAAAWVKLLRHESERAHKKRTRAKKAS